MRVFLLQKLLAPPSWVVWGELKYFLQDQVQSQEYDARERVPWASLYAH